MDWENVDALGRGVGLVVGRQPSKLIYTGSNPVPRSKGPARLRSIQPHPIRLRAATPSTDIPRVQTPRDTWIVRPLYDRPPICEYRHLIWRDREAKRVFVHPYFAERPQTA